MTFNRALRQRVSLSSTLLCVAVTPALGQAAPPTALMSARAHAASPATPDVEPDSASIGAGSSPFGSKAVVPHATGQALSAPVTVDANLSTDALTVTQAGSGRAISGSAGVTAAAR